MITLVIVAYLAVGLYLVINGMIRGLHIELIRGRSRDYRNYVEFGISVALIWLGWLPLLGLRIWMWYQGERSAKAFREYQRKTMGL